MAEATSTDRPDAARRRAVAVLGGLLAAPIAGLATPGAAVVEVWKDPSCGCCKEWVAHLESHGFRTKVHDLGNDAMRSRLGIDRKYGSCHTAVIGGYALEGHVPAGDVLRLLKERPQALGLAVPGMPVGSPGMDGAVYEGRKDPFNVMLLARDGSATVYQRYEGKKS